MVPFLGLQRHSLRHTTRPRFRQGSDKTSNLGSGPLIRGSSLLYSRRCSSRFPPHFVGNQRQVVGDAML